MVLSLFVLNEIYMDQLKLYQIDMKYVRNLHNVDDRVESVSPQIGKDNRVFVGIVVTHDDRQYCIPKIRSFSKTVLFEAFHNQRI